MTVEEHIKALGESLASMTDEERLAVLWKLFERYCTDCGCVRPAYGCHCTNDE